MTASALAPTARKQNLFENVLERFDKAADLIRLDPNIRVILASSNNELKVNFPVKLDNGTVEVFKGYRIQHNNVARPVQGRAAFSPGGQHRRSSRAGRLDDMENLHCRHTIWRCERRHPVRPVQLFPFGT